VGRDGAGESGLAPSGAPSAESAAELAAECQELTKNRGARPGGDRPSAPPGLSPGRHGPTEARRTRGAPGASACAQLSEVQLGKAGAPRGAGGGRRHGAPGRPIGAKPVSVSARTPGGPGHPEAAPPAPVAATADPHPYPAARLLGQRGARRAGAATTSAHRAGRRRGHQRPAWPAHDPHVLALVLPRHRHKQRRRGRR
jgi:hypothetical protein